MKKGDELWLTPESIDLQANGIARHEGMVVFVRGALTGERVLAKIVRVKPRFAVAEVLQLTNQSSQRVRARCPHFGVCGGCSMQHLSSPAQVAIKQRSLEDQFQHIGQLRPETILRPIIGPQWGYRYRARMAVRDVFKKGSVLVGFHEKGSGYVADMVQCEVLPPPVSALLVPLRRLIESLSVRRRLAQIELAVGAGQTPGRLTIALVLRVLDPITEPDRAQLLAFAYEHGVQFWLQPGGPDSIEPLNPDDDSLHYELPEFGLRMPFRPTDFTQVNHRINASLVGQAIRLLDPQPDECIADLFCGLGNFSLPIASRGASVIGLEGAESLCERAAQAAIDNGLADRARFQAADLFQMDLPAWEQLGRLDRVLIDPPREGAMAVVTAVAQSSQPPERIVYVSCNPATLARDAAILVQSGVYRLRSAGVVNMFPHTSHVESIACFDRQPAQAASFV